MSQLRRQRHKLSMLSHLILIVSLNYCIILQLASCQQQQQQQQPLSLSLSLSLSNANSLLAQQTAPRQYHLQRSSTNIINNNNLPLVNSQPTQLIGHRQSSLLAQVGQSLPLIRQQQQQQAELDNVIESTTMQTQQQQPSARLISTSATSTSCQLPPTWTGKWYQSNKEPIRVTNTEISDKGVCRDQKGDKYLFEYSGTSNNNKLQTTSSSNGANNGPCLVCLVINERHLNVLQYKESTCQPIPANYSLNRSSNNNNNQILLDDDHSLLDSICSDITGDAQLESLFRLDTPPIECPISGQYSFNYDSCREPQSSLDSCIDKKQLNFKFSACPDVPGSESKCK